MRVGLLHFTHCRINECSLWSLHCAVLHLKGWSFHVAIINIFKTIFQYVRIYNGLKENLIADGFFTLKSTLYAWKPNLKRFHQKFNKKHNVLFGLKKQKRKVSTKDFKKSASAIERIWKNKVCCKWTASGCLCFWNCSDALFVKPTKTIFRLFCPASIKNQRTLNMGV